MKASFLEQLEDEILVCDGAMGTMLYSKGIYINRCFDELNLSEPKLVQDIHQEYLKSGADIIETNTFGANWYKLAPHGLDGKLYDINYHGAKIAKEIAGEAAFVAGSIGPLGRPIEPLGHITKHQAKEAFSAQAKALYEGGVDLFILETFNDVNELHQAILAVKEVCDLPIIAQMSFSEDGKTIYGVTPTQVVKRIEDWKAHVAGINCSTGPQPILEEIEEMAEVSRMKLSAMPNAGMPRLVEGRLIYLASPEYFAEYAKRFIQLGVRIVGGCCGTTPEHIRAIRAAVKALRPAKHFVAIKGVDRKEQVASAREPEVKSELARKLREKFVTCIEMNPPRSPDPSKVLDGARLIKEHGIDAVNIPDGPRASARMSPLALAAIIESRVGISTILHYTCRDRNILGMQSDLLGAHALGLRNILIVTGDPPKLGDYPTAVAVFNVDSIGLIRIANNLNHGQDLAGNPIGQATAFHIGAGANPGAINFEEEMSRLEQKIDAGAEYILTQPVFDMAVFERFLEHANKYRVPILAGILPLASYRNAEFLHNEVPGMSIPQPIRDRMQKANFGDEARKIGIEIAQEVLIKIKDWVQGAYLMPPFGHYETALKVLEVI